MRIPASVFDLTTVRVPLAVLTCRRCRESASSIRRPAPANVASSGRQVDRAEQRLRAIGFRVLRARQDGELGRVELAADELPRALTDPGPVLAAVRAAGYARAEIDRKPFRSGSLNHGLFTRQLLVV
jgi:PP-loop superfamily ATP-utilizing enzyme